MTAEVFTYPTALIKIIIRYQLSLMALTCKGAFYPECIHK